MNALVLSALLAVANVLGVGMIVPQVRKLGGANSSASGVSGAWVGVGIGLNGWWMAYAVETGLWGLLPVSFGAAVLYLVMAVRLFNHNRWTAVRSIAFGLVLLGLVPAPFLIFSGWTAAGLAIGASYGLQFVPAAVVAVRSADVSGISVTTWVMALIEAAIWWGYGVYSEDRALVVGGVGATAASLVILVRLLSSTWRSGLRVDQTPSATATAS
jgi:hypothetical protein